LDKLNEIRQQIHHDVLTRLALTTNESMSFLSPAPRKATPNSNILNSNSDHQHQMNISPQPNLSSGSAAAAPFLSPPAPTNVHTNDMLISPQPDTVPELVVRLKSPQPTKTKKKVNNK
jgi:hypothetical protein